MAILNRAKEFLNGVTLTELQKGKYTWLNDVFLQMKMNVMMDD